MKPRSSLIAFSRNCQPASPPGLEQFPFVRGALFPLLLAPQTASRKSSRNLLRPVQSRWPGSRDGRARNPGHSASSLYTPETVVCFIHPGTNGANIDSIYMDTLCVIGPGRRARPALSDRGGSKPDRDILPHPPPLLSIHIFILYIYTTHERWRPHNFRKFKKFWGSGTKL
jgi:hypothetical protein